MININMFIDVVGIVNARQSPLLSRQASAVFNYLIGDYLLEIQGQLRKMDFMGGKNIKVTEITNVSDWSDPVDRKLLLD